MKPDVSLNHQRPIPEAIRIATSLSPVAVRLGDTLLAESRTALVLHEPGYPPRYYFPRLDVKMKLFQPSDKTSICPHKGKATYLHLDMADKHLENVAWSYVTPRLDVAEISGFIAFYDEANGITIG